MSAIQLNGKELSYNNLLDLDSALGIVRGFSDPAASVIKHNNPCGAAVGDTLAEALAKGMEGDPLSAFGSVIGMNRTVDADTAEVLAKPGLFVEAIVAPDFTDEALEILKTKPKWKKNVRLMKVGDLEESPERFVFPLHRRRGAHAGGRCCRRSGRRDWKVVTEAQPAENQMADLRFAWDICRYVKSNAIAICKDRMLLGAGAGQMSRVDSVEISINKAGDRVQGARALLRRLLPLPPTRSNAVPRRASRPSFNRAVRNETRKSSTPATSSASP